MLTDRWRSLMNDAGNPNAVRLAWARNHVSPLWENRAAHRNPDDGRERTQLWRWSDMQPLIEAAIAERSLEAIERRVLSLVSPHAEAVGGIAGTTRNLNAGLQILMPGESARPHRHSMNAIRFVLTGSGATTVVDGKPCAMEAGDLVTTPGWCWHEHVHRGSGPIVWLDVLDASLHRYLGTAAFQPGPPTGYPALPPDAAFTSANMVPVTSQPAAAYSPVFRYPWKEAAAAVSAAPIGPDGARCVRYSNPLNGGPIMPFLDCWLLELPPGGETIGFRTTASAVCTVVEGTGTSKVGQDTVIWSPRDVFSLPAGTWISHQSGGGRTRLFIVSDREVLRRLDLLKEEYVSTS
jgi:gentisate 1,2-dioxygenase